MINRIYLPELLADYHTASSDNSISKLNRINIFIGPNNSGKSRFLRGLYSESIQYQVDELVFSKITKVFVPYVISLEDLVKRIGYADISSPEIGGIVNKGKSLMEELKIAKLPTNWSLIAEVKNYISNLKTYQFGGATRINNSIWGTERNNDDLVNRIRATAQKIEEQLSEFLLPIEQPSLDKIYIPVLRGLRPVQTLKDKESSDITFRHTEDNYNVYYA